MIRRVEVAERASIVLALTGYAEALRIAPGGLLPKHMKPADEIARVTRLVDDMTNKFLYLSDQLIFDNTLPHERKEAKLILLPPGKDPREEADLRQHERERAEEQPRTLDSDISEDR